MILGRNPALWLALVAAALNVLVIVFGVALASDQLAALNVLAGVVVGILANSQTAEAVPTFAARTK